MSVLEDKIKAIQKMRPDWDFQQSWEFLEATSSEIFVQSSVESKRVLAKPFHQVEAAARALMAADPLLPFSVALVRARGEVQSDPGTPKDPRVVQELAKHKKLEDSRKSASIDVHVARLSKVRRLMAEKNWSYDQAYTEICRQESEAKKAAPATAGQAVNAVEPKPKGRTLLIRGSEGTYID
jgi:hypothetical protein